MAWSRLIKGGKERVYYSTYLFTSVEFNFPHPPPLPKKNYGKYMANGGTQTANFQPSSVSLTLGSPSSFFGIRLFFLLRTGGSAGVRRGQEDRG